MKLRADTLTARIATGFALMTLTALALFAVGALVLIDADLNAAAHRQETTSTAAIAGALRRAYREDQRWTAADLAPAVALAHAYGVDLRVDTGSGTVLSVTARSADGPVRSFDVTEAGRVVARVRLQQPASGLSPADATLRRALSRSVLVTGLVATALAVVAGVLLARRLARPLERLRAAAGLLGGGAHGTRVSPIAGPVEVRELATAFDDMAADLELEDRLRGALTADVAHELRTPLAVLQAQITALEDGVTDWSPEVASSLGEEVTRLSRLVEDVGTLAAAEAAGLGIGSAPVRLDHVAADTAERLGYLFERQGVALAVDLHPATVSGDADRLGQVTANLLANAARYTPRGGTVQLAVAAQAALATVTVTDTGPGVAPEERERIFDRFVRGAAASGTAGSGIGLAVVRELVTAHGGRVRVTDAPGGGSRFVVTLPAAPAAPDPTATTHDPDTHPTGGVSHGNWIHHTTRIQPPQPRRNQSHGQHHPRIVPP